MTNLGRYRLGEVVPVLIQTRNTSGVPTAPDSVPTVSSYSAGGSAVDADKKVPILGVGNTGLYRYALYLDGGYSAGHYVLRISEVVGGTTRVRLATFEVIPGGHVKGAYTALTYYDKTGGDYLVGVTDSGDEEIRRGPYL